MNSLGLCFFPMSFFSTTVIVICWFGARWFGFLESPKMKGIGISRCSPIRIQNHRAPNQHLTISWFSMSQQINHKLWPDPNLQSSSPGLYLPRQLDGIIGSFHPVISQVFLETHPKFSKSFSWFPKLTEKSRKSSILLILIIIDWYTPQSLTCNLDLPAEWLNFKLFWGGWRGRKVWAFF